MAPRDLRKGAQLLTLSLCPSPGSALLQRRDIRQKMWCQKCAARDGVSTGLICQSPQPDLLRYCPMAATSDASMFTSLQSPMTPILTNLSCLHGAAEPCVSEKRQVVLENTASGGTPCWRWRSGGTKAGVFSPGGVSSALMAWFVHWLVVGIPC